MAIVVLSLLQLVLISNLISKTDVSLYNNQKVIQNDFDISRRELEQKRLEEEKELEERKNWKQDRDKFYILSNPIFEKPERGKLI